MKLFSGLCNNKMCIPFSPIKRELDAPNEEEEARRLQNEIENIIQNTIGTFQEEITPLPNPSDEDMSESGTESSESTESTENETFDWNELDGFNTAEEEDLLGATLLMEISMVPTPPGTPPPEPVIASPPRVNRITTVRELQEMRPAFQSPISAMDFYLQIINDPPYMEEI